MRDGSGRAVAAALAAALGMALLGPRILRLELRRVVSHYLRVLMTDPYAENLWELFGAGARISPQTIIEINQRAAYGRQLARPFGGPKRFPGFDGLVFNIAQLDRLPTPGEVPVNLGVTIGRRAARPLRLQIPLLISGMGYGLAVSEKVKVALARASTLAGTATNTGAGPWLESERQAAARLIVQYGRGRWNKDPRNLRRADMIEIQLGQGAIGGIEHVTAAEELPPKARKLLGLKGGQDAVVPARPPGLERPEHLGHLVEELRRLTGGVPIGAKIGAGKYLERDLAFLVEAGVDAVTVDGAQAATKGSAPLLQDDFGLPTVYALVRAQRFLVERGVRDRVSLLIGGGLFTPGDFLKAIALGADAVYLGTVALFALTHTQVLHALPWEPPTQVVFAQGRYQGRLNVDQAARSLANYLKAAAEEMAAGIRALGKTSLAELGPDDLMALDPVTAEATRVPLAYRPP